MKTQMRTASLLLIVIALLGAALTVAGRLPRFPTGSKGPDDTTRWVTYIVTGAYPRERADIARVWSQDFSEDSGVQRLPWRHTEQVPVGMTVAVSATASYIRSSSLRCQIKINDRVAAQDTQADNQSELVTEVTCRAVVE